MVAIFLKLRNGLVQLPLSHISKTSWQHARQPTAPHQSVLSPSRLSWEPPMALFRRHLLLLALLSTVCLAVDTSRAEAADNWSSELDFLPVPDPPLFGDFTSLPPRLGRLSAALPNGTKFTLIPASHPAVFLPARWHLPAPTGLNDTPILTIPLNLDETLLRRYTAQGNWCKQPATFTFTGSRTLSVHVASPGVLGAAFIYSISGSLWKIPAGPYNTSVLIETGLSPTKNYTVTLLLLGGCWTDRNGSWVGIRFLGFGLDATNGTSLADGANNATLVEDPIATPRVVQPDKATSKQALPSRAVVEFLGDSITNLMYVPWVNTTEDRDPTTVLDVLVGAAEAKLLRQKYPKVLPKPNIKPLEHGKIGSIGLRACEVAGCSPVFICDSGITLIDFPPPNKSHLIRPDSKPGLEYTYFRDYQAWSNDPRPPNNPPPFNFSSQRGYTPQAIVINIGTNDHWRTLLNDEQLPVEFINSYVNLIKGIRAKHGPKPWVVVMMPTGYARILLPVPPRQTKTKTSKSPKHSFTSGQKITTTRRGRRVTTGKFKSESSRMSATMSRRSTQTTKHKKLTTTRRVTTTVRRSTSTVHRSSTTSKPVVTTDPALKRSAEDVAVSLDSTDLSEKELAKRQYPWWGWYPTTTTSASRSTRSTTSTRTTTTTVPPLTTPLWLIRPPFAKETFESVVEHFNKRGDKRVILLDTQGWVNATNVERYLKDWVHPTWEGSRVIGALVGQFLVKRKILGTVGAAGDSEDM